MTDEAKAGVAKADGMRELAALVRALESTLARHVTPAATRDIDMRDMRDMRTAFDLLSRGAPPGRSLIPLLMKDLAMSERTLRRRFDEAFGYGPKTLDRILRFQRFLGLVRAPREASAASLAAEAGYADQAHLVRESRRLAVNTPREIASLLRRDGLSS